MEWSIYEMRHVVGIMGIMYGLGSIPTVGIDGQVAWLLVHMYIVLQPGCVYLFSYDKAGKERGEES